MRAIACTSWACALEVRAMAPTLGGCAAMRCQSAELRGQFAVDRAQLEAKSSGVALECSAIERDRDGTERGRSPSERIACSWEQKPGDTAAHRTELEEDCTHTPTIRADVEEKRMLTDEKSVLTAEKLLLTAED